MTRDHSDAHDRASAATIESFTPADASVFHELRLRALQETPAAFRATYDHESQLPLEKVAERLATPHGFVLGARYGGTWVGTVGFNRELGAKSQHKGLLWGMYVVTGMRGRGVGRHLLRELLARVDAIPGLGRVNLAVSTNNPGALALYEASGFSVYGREPEALQVDGIFYDQWLMTRAIGQRNASSSAP